MALKKTGATVVAMVLAAAAVAMVGLGATEASAATKKRQRAPAAAAVGGPVNYSYQRGRTRVYVTRRSWLDAGTEVLPGERKFSDYAFPPGYSYSRQHNPRYQDRAPLSEHWDLGGYPERFPLY